MQQDQYPHLIIFVVRAGSRLLRLPIRTFGDNLSPVWTPRNEELIIPSFVRLNFREYPISARFRLMLKVHGFDWTSSRASGLPEVLSATRIMHQRSFHRVSSSRFGPEVPFPSIQNLYFAPERKPLQ